jgi:predicted DsbA family dithiol-disulfide isomerase
MESDIMAPPLTITIQTFSDTVCPWSYIGKKNLDEALNIYKEQHPEVDFEMTWNPFYLNPEAKISGEAPKYVSLHRRYHQHPITRRLERHNLNRHLYPFLLHTKRKKWF